MDYQPEELAKMSDQTFYILERSHHPCGRPWCAIEREGYNRPRTPIRNLPFRAFRLAQSFSNFPQSAGL